ncbi:G patch domain-containing protein 4 [Balamuthia mandrillaris]
MFKEPSYKSEAWLEKMGWKKGQGLGRHENGMTEFIRVKKRQDSLGLGAEKKEEDLKRGFEWWDHVYNKASSAWNVEATDSGVKVISQAEQEEKRKKKTAALLANYGGAFVKASEEKETELTKDFSSGLKEDELFAVCGGRTLRKFVPTGKLQRLQQHEQQWKQKDEKETTTPNEEKAKEEAKEEREEEKEERESEERKEKKKKQKKKKTKKKTKEEDETEGEKKQLKKRKREGEEEDKEPGEKKTKKKEKKKNKRRKIEQEETESSAQKIEKKKKKKNKKSN